MDTTAPVLTIIVMKILLTGQLYTDANAGWSDHVDGEDWLPPVDVDVNNPGSVLSYDYIERKLCNHEHTDRHSGGYHRPSANNHR